MNSICPLCDHIVGNPNVTDEGIICDDCKNKEDQGHEAMVEEALKNERNWNGEPEKDEEIPF